jgi:LmbE family N-acetylglucosaminyl deacetylase
MNRATLRANRYLATPQDNPSTNQRISPIARALADEANAKHELARFRALVEPVRLLATLLDNAPTGSQVSRKDLDTVITRANTAAEFFGIEFDVTAHPDRLAPGLEPTHIAALPNLVQLAASRTAKPLLRHDLGKSQDLADLKATWAQSSQIEGLANLPLFLREARQQLAIATQRGAGSEVTGFLQQQVSDLSTTVSSTLQHEMLMMASFQPSEFGEAATELIEQDLRPSFDRLFEIERETHPELVDVKDAAKEVGVAIEQFDVVDELGQHWASGLESAVSSLHADGAVSPSEAVEVLSFGSSGPAPDQRVAVFVAPHADDEASKLGALAAQLSTDGVYTVLVVMVDNSAGAAATGTPWERRMFPDVRRLELEAASAALGFSEVVSMNWGDSGMEHDPAMHRRRLADQSPADVAASMQAALGDINPHVVITIQEESDQLGYRHPDHLATERATRELVGQLSQGRVGPTYYVASLHEELLNHHAQSLSVEVGPATSRYTTAVPVSLGAVSAEREALLAYGSQVSGSSDALWRQVHPGVVNLKRISPRVEAGAAIETQLMFSPAVGEVSRTVDPPVTRTAVSAERGSYGIIRSLH